jgi:hypothetical protein
MNEPEPRRPGGFAGPELPLDPTGTGGAGRGNELTGREVITRDRVPVGRVESVTDTHLSVRTPESSDAPGGQLWVPKALIATADAENVYLTAERADLHEAVLALPPGQQREFQTLGFIGRLGRARGMLVDR